MPWIGLKRIAVVPAIVNDAQFDPPPPDWKERVNSRIFYDPEPNSGADRSFRAYVHTVSYGKALVEADVFDPVPVQSTHCGGWQDRALQQLPAGHLYEYACVVFTGGSHACDGWAFWGHFPGTVRLNQWCHVSMDAPLGTWAMELLHILTGFGDLYDGIPHPGQFDVMACACGPHPSTFTKLKMGWLDPANVPTLGGRGPAQFTLHGLALLQPPPPGRVTALKVPSNLSQRYFLVEARLRADPYESAIPGVSAGIPSEGVVVYEVDETQWPPVFLRTPTALSPGQEYENQAESLEITVDSRVPGGFTVTIQTPQHPGCSEILDEIRAAEDEIRGLQEQLGSAGPDEKAAIIREIRRWQVVLSGAQQRARDLGCDIA